ncbi:MAG: helix-turn-helix domain containing protein [Bacteroidales bacterium]|nr:helix-turn-helix domain containing protein [Bacteroidales bacterium]
MECFTEVNKVELLEKISELFKKFGLRSTSMDEIAMHLKMSKKTLYQMFDNKTDIVEQISILRQKKLFDIEESKNRILKQENLLEQFYIGMQHMAHSLDSFKTNNHYDKKNIIRNFTKNMFAILMNKA